MTTLTSSVLAVRPAAPEEARRHFAARLRFETDVADVGADVRAGAVPYVLADVRSPEDFARGHARGAVNLPLRAIDAETVAALPAGPIVVYCWGPGCNGAQRAAQRLARLGRPVKEMIGGFEYWVLEGQPIEGSDAATLARATRPDLVGAY